MQISTTFFLRPFFLALLTASISHAQVFDLEYYTTRDGLVSNGVGDIYQDQLGRLWLGTTDGLSIYDGSKFKNYRTDNGLPRDFITCIAASRESPTGAWIGTLGGGVCKLVEDRFSYISLGSVGNANHITALLEDRKGILWIGTVEGLYKVVDGTPQRHALDIGKGGVSGLAAKSDGGLWVGLSRIAVLLRDDQPPLSFDLGIASNDDVSTTYMDEHDDMWVGTSKGYLIRCNEKGVVGRARVSEKELRGIIADRDGALWICSEDALLRLDHGPPSRVAAARFGAENGFTGEFFVCVFFDREDNLWIGGQQTGLCKLRDRSLLKFPLSKVLPEQGYKPPVVVDSTDHLWVADGEGLNELWQQSNSVWKVNKHLTGAGKIHCLQLGSNNTLWVGYLNYEIQIYRLGKTNQQGSRSLQLLRKLQPGVELPPNWAYFILDRRGALWVVKHPDGVIVLEGDDFAIKTTLTPPEQVPHPDIRSIYQDRKGDVWIGGLDSGIVVYRWSEDGYTLVRKLTTGAGLDNDEIRSIYVDSLGRCWAGTRWGGITLTDGDTWRTLTTADGLSSMAVYSIAQDSTGTIWVGTTMGVHGVNAGSFRVTRTLAGLSGVSIGSCGTTRSFLWAFARRFLAVYDLSKAGTSISPPLISIREFRVNGTDRSTTLLLELSHAENNIAIDFTGISLKNEKQVRYRYRLLGAEEDWAPLTPYRSVTYATLRPGEYRFEVQAINSDGIASESPASASFTILPPLWQLLWFQLGALMFTAVLLWIVHRYRVAKLLDIERTRLRIAQDLHDEIGSTLSSISYFAQAVRSTKLTENEKNRDRLLSLIVESSTKAKGAISDIIWSIDPSNDNWDELLARMRRHASDVLESKGIRYRINLPEGLSTSAPNMQQRRHLWLLFKEIVANAAQHSHCSLVDITMKVTNRTIDLRVSDDGIGFDKDKVVKGTGVRSIQDRARSLGATVELHTDPGKGTQWSVQWRQ